MKDLIDRPTSLPDLATDSPPDTPRRLLVCTPAGVQTFDLPQDGEVLLGRGSTAQVPLVDPVASRVHARLRLSNGAVELTDLSSNGTSVNGERLDGTRALHDGDCLRIGTTTLVLQCGRPAPRPAPEDPAGVVYTLGPRRVLIADPALRALYQRAMLYADADSPVLILGETGVGKDLLAAALHFFSKRGLAGKPFEAYNCGAFGDTIVESQLFGHERGAFTGAVARHSGAIEQAHQGTLFLDEIGELAPLVQVKLLRTIETGHFRPIGAKAELTSRFRLVAATNRDLEAEVRAGRFREDLLFRINTTIVHVAPLRERPGDIALLAQVFLDEQRQALSRPPCVLSLEALRCLCDYAWPGNVRQLRNVMHDLAVNCPDGAVPRDALPAQFLARGAAATGKHQLVQSPLARELEDLEKQRIVEALEANGGVVARAARQLDMPERTLWVRIHRYQLRNRGRQMP